MGTINIQAGHTIEDNSYILGAISVRPPFKQPIGILSQEYIKDTDFNANDTVNIIVQGTAGIRFVMITKADGTPITYTESAPSTGSKQIQFLAPSTNVKVLIVFNT